LTINEQPVKLKRLKVRPRSSVEQSAMTRTMMDSGEVGSGEETREQKETRHLLPGVHTTGPGSNLKSKPTLYLQGMEFDERTQAL
jgi:hypothetical protein